MKPRRPEVAMTKEGKKMGEQGRLRTQGRPGTPLLRMEVGGARHTLASGRQRLAEESLFI